MLVTLINGCHVINLNLTDDDKTEMLIFHAKHRPAALLDQLQVATSSFTASASTKNIVVVLDSTLSLSDKLVRLIHTCTQHLTLVEDKKF